MKIFRIERFLKIKHNMAALMAESHQKSFILIRSFTLHLGFAKTYLMFPCSKPMKVISKIVNSRFVDSPAA